jgi:protein-S-isoprenylcysteine O-methyltransferase Ste14
MADSSQDVANLGLARPPLVYSSLIVVGAILEYLWRLPFLPDAIAVPLGILLVVAAVALFVASVGKFRAAGTPVPGNQPTTAIVRVGPYRLSRNPIYLAFSLLHLGIAIWANSLWLVATLIAAILVMALVVIPREERYLERRFGADYLDYKNSVRRWI